MTLTIKPSHVLDAEKIANVIYSKSPLQQQEMLETIKIRVIKLNSEHLEKLKK